MNKSMTITTMSIFALAVLLKRILMMVLQDMKRKSATWPYKKMGQLLLTDILLARSAHESRLSLVDNTCDDC